MPTDFSRTGWGAALYGRRGCSGRDGGSAPPARVGRPSHGATSIPLRLLLAASVWAPAAALAEPPEIADRLARFRQTAAIEYRYEETRTLELLAAPWKGKGYLLSSPDGTLVKLQLSPERVVMAVSGERLYYHAQEQRQSAPLDAVGSLARPIGALRALLQGCAEELKASYEIRTEISGKRDIVILTGKPQENGKPAPSLEVSDETARRRRIVIRQPDGEKTVYLLEKAAEGKHLEPWIQRLRAEAAGD